MAKSKKMVRVKGTREEAQAKINIANDWPPGRKTKAIGKRKTKTSGGRGKMLKRKSKTGYVTGGGF